MFAGFKCFRLKVFYFFFNLLPKEFVIEAARSVISHYIFNSEMNRQEKDDFIDRTVKMLKCYAKAHNLK